MDIDRGLTEIGKRNPFIVTQLDPHKINRHDEAAFIGLHCDRDNSLEEVKDIAEWGMNAGGVAECPNCPMNSWKPAVN